MVIFQLNDTFNMAAEKKSRSLIALLPRACHYHVPRAIEDNMLGKPTVTLGALTSESVNGRILPQTMLPSSKLSSIVAPSR